MKKRTIISLVTILLAWKSASGQPIDNIDNYTARNNCNDTVEVDFSGIAVIQMPENEKVRLGHFNRFNMYCDGHIVMLVGGGGMMSKVIVDSDFINENNDTMSISHTLLLGENQFYIIPKFQAGKFDATSCKRIDGIKLDSILPPDCGLRQMVVRMNVWQPEERDYNKWHELRYLLLKDQLFSVYWWSDGLRKISD